MKKVLIGIVIILVAGAIYLGWRQFQQGDYSAEVMSGITGLVLLGPTCPVVQYPPDPGCDDKPYATKLVLTTADQAQVIAEFSSDANGRFNVAVKPGEYAVRSAAAANILPYCASSNTIKVVLNSFTEVVIQCDTGIR